MKYYFFSFGLLFAATTVSAKNIAKKNPDMHKAVDSEQLSESPSEESESKIAKPKTRNGKKIVRLKSDEVLEDSSEANREGKTLSLTFEPIGFAPLPVHGGALGYYLSPNNLLELSYAAGEIDFLIAKIDNRMTSLHLKTFWGNSFYTNLGLGSRMLGYRFLFSEVDSNGNYTGRDSETTMQNTSMGLDFSIGNRWQWDTFTIGCDWVGFFSPLSTTGENTITGKNLSASDISDANEAMDRFSKQGSAQFLRFYLGVSI